MNKEVHEAEIKLIECLYKQIRDLEKENGALRSRLGQQDTFPQIPASPFYNPPGYPGYQPYPSITCAVPPGDE